jgi:beta-carotene hydroxylase
MAPIAPNIGSSDERNPMDASLMRRPAIPREYYEPTLRQGVVFFLVTACWVILPGVLAVTIAKSDWALWAKVAACLPLIALAANGFHLVGWFAHEGIHLSLAKNRYVSIVIGILVSGVSLFPAMGYGITHWNHHRFTNQESDPDASIYPRHRTFWARFFLARLTANRGYIRNCAALALGKPLDKGYRLPFTDPEQRLFAALTLANMGLWLGIYAAMTYLDPVAGAVGVIAPLALTIPLSGLRIYLEHNGTGAGVFRDTRSYVSPFYTFLLYGNNMHLEHHLYPKVPCYNLAKVHAYLRNQGYYEQWGSHIATGILEPLRFVGSRYQYPSPRLSDLPADPFQAGYPPMGGCP